MYVPSYQMHNVLNVYAKRLERSVGTRTKAGADPSQPSEKIQLTAEGKRQSVIDKVASTIVERIARFGPRNETERQIVRRLNDEVADQGGEPSARWPEFRFNRIDSGSEKRADSLKVDDGGFVFKRLEQLARETVDRQMVSSRPTGGESQA
jgi:hypothetical protein